MDDLMSEVNQRTNLAFSNEMEMLTFFLTDGQLYGLNVFKIIEILETPKEITVMPESGAGVIGTIDFRGHAITVIDLSVALGLPPVDLTQGVSYILVCEYSTSTQGFLIARPDRLINKSWTEIIAPTGTIFEGSYLTAITYHQNVPIQILDVEMILANIIGIDDHVSDDLVAKSKQIVQKQHHILAADDSRAARTLLASALNQMGIQHTIVENAERAYELLEQSVQEGSGHCPYNLVISDIEMPIMDGFTFTRKVKENPKMSHIYLVLHSSLSNKSNSDKAKKMGANDFIPKFQPDKIMSVILEQLEKAEQHAQAAS
ncbi:MAG: chemotaxis protein CheV [Magnetococcales bacterium]|nr:chemotaxis protein CheV [Magnetococcales bacterium]MBF0151931.1 chemotaxis protein CheV [Magnetococcales bacterium]MBF0172993.1 chemotaxis protein CheV [Magnetococcales bacterium]MBF0348968.1 chemotaxis protein CheV [Magnetococcales bacterium]MBF0631957.1 chemotaxis protein CheV [Magnetococcales bacterium]